MDIIPYKKLPEKARNFIETYFNDYYVFKTTFTSSYSVVFKGGSSVNFTSRGEWTSIIGNGNEIAFSIIEKLAEDNIIEKEVINTIKEKYDSFTIYRIIKKKNKYEIEIDNNNVIIDIKGSILKNK
ncbi:PepSY-like domain-containing protein [Brachyspira innocens]|uniref:PepSY-like domain-containing protein n=1 Tax=Brachyspira innocens TaxID=13264 RepID=A0ABT8YUH1_9SPIR|nr:PepSY-like domain-containing protein [Brachyspira innocens]MDO6993949.1 PepSY-like domain-containing protein [Brachyspira innocens]MDO7019511.1 PepSY-like domain-containing protein [Brachyspira innocens]